jgi:hypothetical protein
MRFALFTQGGLNHGEHFMVGEVAYSGGSGWAGHGTSAATFAEHFLDLREQDTFTDVH